MQLSEKIEDRHSCTIRYVALPSAINGFTNRQSIRC